MDIVDFLWIVPSTEDLFEEEFDEWEDHFTFLDLDQNFRNSREIVKMIREIGYRYGEGIAMPPENFPTGLTPIFVDSFEDAMTEARKRTKEGILVINNFQFGIFNRMKEKWKAYRQDRNDFKEENPYKFLQEGNVLIIDDLACFGFEWATVVVFEGAQTTERFIS